MKILLDTTELKSLYSILRPLCDYVPFSSAICRIISVSLNNYSRSQSSEIWELIENCEDEELQNFLNMSTATFTSTFELNIELLIEHVFKYVERVSGVILDNCNFVDSEVVGNTLIIDIQLK
jgi:hypothetical protein